MSREPGRQLSLFDEPRPVTSGVVGPAATPGALLRTARALPANVRLGTSSWSFPGWEGAVYDRAATKSHLARHGLAAYARHPLLRAVGIDRTFYAPLPAAAFAEYAAVVSDDFRFLVKAANLCTTPRNELFLDPAWARDEVVAPFVEGLGAKAGTLVFQFPPLGDELRREPARFAERLAGFLGALPEGPVYAVELRDDVLLGKRYFAALAATGARHCFSVHPRMPSVDEQRRLAGAATAGPLVVRWMLHEGLGYEQAVQRYEPFGRLVDEDVPTRAALADLCYRHARHGLEVIVVANNKAEGSAPLTVFRLAESIVWRYERDGAGRSRAP